MGLCHSDTAAYGIRITDTAWWDLEETKYCTEDPVAATQAGAYDEHKSYLVIRETLKSLEPGEPMAIEPWSPSDQPYLDWDGQLVQAAEDLKVEILSKPAWMFLPSDS